MAVPAEVMLDKAESEKYISTIVDSIDHKAGGQYAAEEAAASPPGKAYWTTSLANNQYLISLGYATCVGVVLRANDGSSGAVMHFWAPNIKVAATQKSIAKVLLEEILSRYERDKPTTLSYQAVVFGGISADMIMTFPRIDGIVEVLNRKPQVTKIIKVDKGVDAVSLHLATPPSRGDIEPFVHFNVANDGTGGVALRPLESRTTRGSKIITGSLHRSGGGGSSMASALLDAPITKKKK